MAAPDFVNGVAGALVAGATYVLPAFAATTGNAVLVFGRLNNNATTITGIADTASNTYTQLTTDTNGGSRIFLWVANNITGNATNIITVTFSGADAFPEFAAIQIVDENTANPVTWAAYRGSPLTPGFFEVENSLIVTCGEVAATGSTWTPSTGFTTGAEGTDQVVTMSYRKVTTLTSLSPTLTTSSGAAKQMITALLIGGGASGGGTVAYAAFG